MQVLNRQPSLKRRLLMTLMLPLCGILLVLGVWGGWFVHRAVENASDRVLSGSLQAISETLAMEGGYITLDLPPSALGMLENADRDNVYYNVSYRGGLITGYPELSVINPRSLPLELVQFRNATFRGVPIRVAMEAKLVPQLDTPVVIQVAETVTNRTAVANRILLGLSAFGLFLLLAVAGLVYVGIQWGLKPLALLRDEVEERTSRPEINFAPLPLSLVPQEALPFVATFNVLLDHVETGVETLRRFTADASHQLRAPLAVLRTHIELLRRQSRQADGIEATVSDIYMAITALQHLIVQLISLAKAERPSTEIDGANHFDIVECAANTARNYAMPALAANMEISFESGCEELQAFGNPIFASEMISNLLDNAIRYGNPGGHIIVRVIGESGILEVEDDGPGVPPAERERVFERFYRLPRNLNREGSGLGLSIVQALGRRVGATVRLEAPASGKGLKVLIKFRLLAASDRDRLATSKKGTRRGAHLAPAPKELRPHQTVKIGE
ncbi:MAG: sensor histidine kinase [Pseudomonadota bacterium]